MSVRHLAALSAAFALISPLSVRAQPAPAVPPAPPADPALPSPPTNPVTTPAMEADPRRADVAGPSSSWPLDRRLQWAQQALGQNAGAGIEQIRAEEARLKSVHGAGLTKADRNYLARRIDALLRDQGASPPPWAI